MVIKLFDHWGLSWREQGMVLGLPCGDQWTIHGLRHGRALSPKPDLMERVGHILAIHRLLRILFPQQRDLAYAWMMSRNAAFGELAPTHLLCQRLGPAWVGVIAGLLGTAGASVKCCCFQCVGQN